MENLYIKVENGQTVDHPYLEENLLQLYGSVPSNFAPFKRVDLSDTQITVGFFQKSVSSYVLDTDGVTWTDSYTVIDMTDAEKQDVINQFNKNPPYPNAVFNETNLMWQTPKRPKDGQNYSFNFTTGVWEVVTT